ncbi:MAG: putative Ig domain-containing protein, partial [Anaerolineales bacterium]|nr:putative Ig domain-containing protein [Anaerolineales bacterium]
LLLTVTDREGQSATQAFTISVDNLNDPPIFTSTPPTLATRGRLYTYEITATDPDQPYGDSLTFSAPTLPSWLSLVDHGDGTATLSGTPANTGQYNIVLKVTDSKGLAASQSLTISVVASNDPPFFITRPITTTWQGSLYSYEIRTSDPDLTAGESLSITALQIPNWLTLEDHHDNTATLSGIPTNAEVGNHAVTLRVTDSGGLIASQAFTITVYNLNDPPVFTSQPITTALQGILYTYEVTATDPDLIFGDSLSIHAISLPSWLTLIDHGDGTATLSGSPLSSGSYTVILRVQDNSWTYAEQRFVILVEEAPRFRLYLPYVTRNEETIGKSK